VAEEREEARDEELDAEAQARRRLALAQIRQYPDPVLRMPAREVEQFDDDLRRLVERMKGLMHDAVGAGLAGNQVGVLQRVFVFRPPDEEETLTVVNPRLVAQSGTQTADEGCLSLQGIHVPVERSLDVTIEGQDEHGSDVRYELTELAARIVQHELDHLDGVLMLDRTTDEARREAMSILRPRTILTV
jgi:peptide deformylase